VRPAHTCIPYIPDELRAFKDLHCSRFKTLFFCPSRKIKQVYGGGGGGGACFELSKYLDCFTHMSQQANFDFGNFEIF